MADLKIAMRFGWRYEWVRDLDAGVHSLLVDELIRDLEEAES